MTQFPEQPGGLRQRMLGLKVAVAEDGFLEDTREIAYACSACTDSNSLSVAGKGVFDDCQDCLVEVKRIQRVFTLGGRRHTAAQYSSKQCVSLPVADGGPLASRLRRLQSLSSIAILSCV